MRIMVLGLRGFPGVEGGVEKHAEHLYPLLADLGCDVDVIVRSQYYQPGNSLWEKIEFHSLWAPKISGLEAFIHSFFGVLYAGIKRPDILHIHAIGPAIMTPLARLLGLRVVVTHHGPDYDREKWGFMARKLLQFGERWGMMYSTERIVISDVIRNIVKNKYNCDSVLIPNGVELPSIPTSRSTLEKFSIETKRYALLVSRFVPEKRHLDLIRAFTEAKLAGWKLVLVGRMDKQDKYCKEVLGAADGNENVILTGYQDGVALHELYANAGIFVLPSTHEGLPIALLEALSYGIPVLASDIPANLEVGLPLDQYFPVGNLEKLAEALRFSANSESDPERQDKVRKLIKERYSWENIAGQTYSVYSSTVNK